jgi:tRNA threonylcarbamoyl adenosine modification protein YeaZ
MEKSSNNDLNEKICLAFDATNRWIIAGLYGPLESSIQIEANRDSFTQLTPILSDLIRNNGIKKPDWIVTTLGPGSFTGTKISVTAARTLSLLWNIPLLGVDSLTFYTNAIREIVPTNTPIGVLLDAKQKKVYAKLSGEVESSDDLKMNDTLLDILPDELFEKSASERKFFADDPDVISKYLTKEWPFTINHFPEINAKVLYRTGILMGGIHAAGSYENAIPIYLRVDPATNRYPEGLKR